MTDPSPSPNSARQGTASGAWAGFGAAAAGLALAIVVRLLTGIPTVAEAIAEAVTILIPVALFDALLGLFGTLAKPLLVVVIGLGVLAAGAAIGWAAARTGRRARAVAVAAALAALLGIGLPLLLGAVPTALAGIASTALFGFIFATAFDPTAPADPEADASRRHVLQWAGIGGVLLLSGGLLWRLLSSGGRAIAGALPPPTTPNDEFYVISKNLIDPSVDLASWRLDVTGLVAEPMELTLDQLRALGEVEQLQTLECISNEVGGHLISTARWRGVPLRALVAAVRPDASVVELKLTSADGYSESIPLAMASDERVLLAFEMNGKPLPERHGFPLRLLLPGTYGMKGPKWLIGIEAVDTPYEGYWEQRGWTKEALIKTMSRLDAPASSEPLDRRTPISLAGIAFAGDRGISAVELQLGDEAAWVRAELDPAVGDSPAGVWRFWRYAWSPARAGTFRVRVRAIDGRGSVQSAQVTGTLPDGASGYDGTSYTVS
jgi:hypothetical protein